MELLTPTRRAAPALLLAGALFWLAAAVAAPARGEARHASEYDLKAAFLLNFTHFVEWPPESFAKSDSPLEVCILGPDPFGGALDGLVRGESAGGHPLAVRRVERPADAAGCHLLFLAHDEDAASLARVPGVREGTVLAIGESDDFLARGGFIRFLLQEGRIRLQVSTTALASSKLRVSSKLLRLTEPVTPAPQRG